MQKVVLKSRYETETSQHNSFIVFYAHSGKRPGESGSIPKGRRSRPTDDNRRAAAHSPPKKGQPNTLRVRFASIRRFRPVIPPASAARVLLSIPVLGQPGIATRWVKR